MCVGGAGKIDCTDTVSCHRMSWERPRWSERDVLPEAQSRRRDIPWDLLKRCSRGDWEPRRPGGGVVLSLQQEPTCDFGKCRESGYALDDDLWPTDRCGREQMASGAPRAVVCTVSCGPELGRQPDPS